MLYGVTSEGAIVTIDVSPPGYAEKQAERNAQVGVTVTVDFNPVADRLRVMTSDGTSLRVNVDDGKAVVDGSHKFKEGDANAGKTPKIIAGAYSNSLKGTQATALYNIDATTGSLVLQAPPNDGTLNTIGSLGIKLNGNVAFNIVARRRTRTRAGCPWAARSTRSISRPARRRWSARSTACPGSSPTWPGWIDKPPEGPSRLIRPAAVPRRADLFHARRRHPPRLSNCARQRGLSSAFFAFRHSMTASLLGKEDMQLERILVTSRTILGRRLKPATAAVAPAPTKPVATIAANTALRILVIPASLDFRWTSANGPVHYPDHAARRGRLL